MAALSRQLRATPERGRLWRDWTVAVMLGELLGFALPALAGTAAWQLGAPQSVLYTALVIAGLGEGAVLGWFQARVLGKQLAGFSRRDWIALTAGAAGFAWILGLGISRLGQWEGGPIALRIGLAALIGVIFLLTMGGAQWIVLRRHVTHAGRWILANAVAWPIGVAIPVLAMALVPDAAPVAAFVATGIGSGIVMGLVVGMITGAFLVRLRVK
jgi:hypothetical protein